MVGRAVIAVAGLLVSSSLSWQAAGEESSPAVVRAGEYRLPFQLRDGLIYIRAQVNGSCATLVVDTGAAFTTFTDYQILLSGKIPILTLALVLG